MSIDRGMDKEDSVHIYNGIYRCNAIPNNIPEIVFVDIDNIILNFIWKGKGTRRAETILKKKSKVGGISLPDFKSIYSYSNEDCVVLVEG